MRDQRDENVITNLIKAKVELQMALEDLHWTLNYRAENNQQVSIKDIAEMLNKAEAAIAGAEYKWENRTEKL